MELNISTEDYDKITDIIQRDCRFFERCKIIDYSMLIGIHDREEFNQNFGKKISFYIIERELGKSHTFSKIEKNFFKKKKDGKRGSQDFTSGRPKIKKILRHNQKKVNQKKFESFKALPISSSTLDRRYEKPEPVSSFESVQNLTQDVISIEFFFSKIFDFLFFQKISKIKFSKKIFLKKNSISSQ